MNKPNFSILLLLFFMILPLQAFASTRAEIDTMLQDRISWAEVEGYEVFFTDVSDITASPAVSYYFDLNPGYFVFFADAGDEIVDLDMYVYDENNYELTSDTLNDNYPQCEITVTDTTRIYVEISVYEFAKGNSSGMFSLMAAGKAAQNQKQNNSGYTMDDVTNYWTDWAQDRGYQILYNNSGVLTRDFIDTYEFDLERGNYDLVVESLNENDDIDLFIYDATGKEITSDTLVSNYGYCSFELRAGQTVSVEVSPVTYASGTDTEYMIMLSAQGGGLSHDFPTIENLDRNMVVDAEADADFIESLLGDYMEMLASKGYQNIYDETGVLKQGANSRIQITLGRGTYMVYGHAGLRILDIDLRVFDGNGYVVAEDTLINDSPLCEFSVQVSGQYEIEIDCYEMLAPWNEGNYMVVIARK